MQQSAPYISNITDRVTGLFVVTALKSWAKGIKYYIKVVSDTSKHMW